MHLSNTQLCIWVAFRPSESTSQNLPDTELNSDTLGIGSEHALVLVSIPAPQLLFKLLTLLVMQLDQSDQALHWPLSLETKSFKKILEIFCCRLKEIKHSQMHSMSISKMGVARSATILLSHSFNVFSSPLHFRPFRFWWFMNVK